MNFFLSFIFCGMVFGSVCAQSHGSNYQAGLSQVMSSPVDKKIIEFLKKNNIAMNELEEILRRELSEKKTVKIGLPLMCAGLFVAGVSLVCTACFFSFLCFDSYGEACFQERNEIKNSIEKICWCDSCEDI